MNEYRIECICSRCGGKDNWFMLTEKFDKESVITEAYSHIENVTRSGYKCNQCLSNKFIIKRITFTAED